MNHVRQGPRSAPSHGLLVTLIRRPGIYWCHFFLVTPEKEMQMCRGLVGPPSHPQAGVWSRKLSRAKTHRSIGPSATLCTHDCSFYLILNLFKFSKYLSAQKWDESTSSGFLRCHSETAHFPLHWKLCDWLKYLIEQTWKLWCLVHSRKCCFVSTQLNTVQHWFIKNIINEITVVINIIYNQFLLNV